MAKARLEPDWCPRCKRDATRGDIACDECYRKYYEDLERRQNLKAGCNCCELRFYTELNVGFVGVVETDEHLERLRKPDDDITAEHARSKISRTNSASISAVNRVAARVVRK